MNSWLRPIAIEGEMTSPHDWLKLNHNQHSHQENADTLTKYGFPVTKNAVHKKCQREHWTAGSFPLTPDQPNEQIETQVLKNSTVIIANSARMHTLDAVLKECNVDLSVWRVDRYVVNTWEVGAKAEEKDLVYSKGVLDGTIKSPGLTITPLYQIKVWLIRIKPEPSFPTIQPITCPQRKPPMTTDSRPQATVRRALIWADPHFGFTRDLKTGVLTPFHDRKALDLVQQIAAKAGADRMIGLGDLEDLAEWSDRFLRSPEFCETTQPALNEAHWWLAQFRDTLPNAQMQIHQGNHEKRMEDAVIRNFRAAYELRAVDELSLPPSLSLERLLALDKLKIGWVGDYPNDETWLNSVLRLSHGDTARAGAGDTVKNVVLSSDTTEIVGHIHRIEWASRTRHTRERRQVVIAFCPGCLCHIDGRVPAKSGRQQWQQGFCIVDYEETGETFSISPILINEGRAMWNGKLFESRDRLPEIQSAFPDWSWA